MNPAPPPPPVNQAPIVSAGAAQTITLPASAALTGSVSDDGLPVGAVVTNTWSEVSGPGSVTFQNAASPVTAATFGQAGIYVLRLTATDTELTGFRDVTITVSRGNANPTSNPGGPYSGIVGQSVAFDGSHSSDPDNDSLTYSWTFGDGAVGSGPNPTHTYLNADRFTAMLTVSDGNGGTSIATVFVAISQPNRPPIVSAGGPYSGSTRAAIVFSAAASDPDADVLSFAWDFGDGSAQAAGQNPSHLYASPGTYTASVTARDTSGASAFARASVSIVIVNSPPAFTSSPTTTAKHQMPYAYQAAVIDPDGDAITFSLAQAPAGMAVGAHTGLIEWTPITNQLGNQAVTLVATDSFQAKRHAVVRHLRGRCDRAGGDARVAVPGAAGCCRGSDGDRHRQHRRRVGDVRSQRRRPQRRHGRSVPAIDLDSANSARRNGVPRSSHRPGHGRQCELDRPHLQGSRAS